MRTFVTIEIDSLDKESEFEALKMAVDDLLETGFDISTHRFDEMFVKTEVKRIAETAQERILING